MDDLVRNEENEYPVPNPNRMMISMSSELNDVHKELLKEELKNEFIEILMEKLQEKVKENIQNQLKHTYQIKTTQAKNLRRHRNK
jgi:hypothetical protein